MDLITALPAKARTFVDDSPWLALGTAVVLVLITRMLAQTVRSRAVASRLASRARMKRAARDAKRAARDVPALLAALPDAARCDEILALTATELRDALRDRNYTSVEVTTLYVDVFVVCGVCACVCIQTSSSAQCCACQSTLCSYIARCIAITERINCITEDMFEEALEAARDSDVRLQSGDASLIRPLGAFVVVIANTVDVLACHLLMLHNVHSQTKTPYRGTANEHQGELLVEGV